MITVHTDATPLELIERTVLDQAKGIDLDLDDDAARARMRDLITDAVARWSDDYRRGLRSHDLADPELLVERAYRNLVGYGPLESLLADDDVWEVMINAPDVTLQVSRSTMVVRPVSASPPVSCGGLSCRQMASEAEVLRNQQRASPRRLRRFAGPQRPLIRTVGCLLPRPAARVSVTCAP